MRSDIILIFLHSLIVAGSIILQRKYIQNTYDIYGHQVCREFRVARHIPVNNLDHILRNCMQVELQWLIN